MTGGSFCSEDLRSITPATMMTAHKVGKANFETPPNRGARFPVRGTGLRSIIDRPHFYRLSVSYAPNNVKIHGSIVNAKETEITRRSGDSCNLFLRGIVIAPSPVAEPLRTGVRSGWTSKEGKNG